MATSTLSTVVQLPNNQNAQLIIKADIAQIGTSQPGTEGHDIALDYGDAQGVGANSGKTIYGTGSTASAGFRIFQTVPTFAAGPTAGSNPIGTNAVLKSFSITAGSNGSLGLYQVAISIATSSAVVSNLKLNVYTQSNYTGAATVPGSSSGQFGVTDGDTTSGGSTEYTDGVGGTLTSSPTLYFNQGSNSPLEIGAGTTNYFTLTGNVAPNASATNWTIFATVEGDSSYPSLSGFMGTVANVAAAASGNFIWSPNATTTSVITANDWTSGYGVSGLPANGF